MRPASISTAEIPPPPRGDKNLRGRDRCQLFIFQIAAIRCRKTVWLPLENSLESRYICQLENRARHTRIRPDSDFPSNTPPFLFREKRKRKRLDPSTTAKNFRKLFLYLLKFEDYVTVGWKFVLKFEVFLRNWDSLTMRICSIVVDPSCFKYFWNFHILGIIGNNLSYKIPRTEIIKQV